VNAFVDTNVIVYAHDRMDHAKRERARALLEKLALDGSLTVSTQVLQESYNALIRKLLVGPAKALFAVEKLAAARVVGANADFVLDAIRLSQRFQLSVWDALIVQAALAARCTTLFTEDMQAGQRFGELEVVNPFSDSVHEPHAAWSTPAAKKIARKPAAKRPVKR
jgi:predicted nucleic acid-binding protein